MWRLLNNLHARKLSATGYLQPSRYESIMFKLSRCGAASKLAAGFLLLVCLQGIGATALQGPDLERAARTSSYALEDLIAIARRDNQALQAVRAQSLAARAGITSSRAFPNPEIEWMRGPVRPLIAGAPSGTGGQFSIGQRLENPALRAARSGAAEAVARGAEIGVRAAENNLIAAIKVQFFEVLRRQEEVTASSEDVLLTQQIRDRVAVRVRTGEGARFDLMRADNELALAQRELERGRGRVAQARAALVGATGSPLPESFSLNGDFYKSLPQADYRTLRELAVSANPDLRRAEADVSRAERQVEVEQQSLLPSVSLRLSRDDTPDTSSIRAGIALAIPLWDRRRGPVDEARAQLLRSRSESESRRFEQLQGFEAAWHQFQSALGAVRSLEIGILPQARSIVEVAEAAYRFGERGILEYLDARRQFRLARNDLITARFELYVAKTDLERIAARDIEGVRE